MVKLVNRAKMTTASTGTGTITLGSASDGYQTFAAAGVSNGDEVRYAIEDGNEFELGVGQYTASGSTLSRTVSESSNSNNALNLSGNAVVFVTAIADDVGVRTYATISAMTSSTAASSGALAFVTANSGLYQNNGNGWYKVATVNTSPAISAVSETTSGSTTALSNSGTFALTAGANTVVTITASDADEGTDLVYTKTVTSGTESNVATISQGSGASENVFTFAPASSVGGTITVRFDVTDNTNTAQFTNSFSLTFTSWANATQQAKVQASDPEQWSNFGWAVSISSDGDTAIASTPYATTSGSQVGAVYIFTRSGTSWSQQQKLQASDKAAGDQFGMSVSISNDGDTAIVGARREDTNGDNAGAAYIFTRSGTSWSQQQKIQASNAGQYDEFGQSVSISGDGNRVVVGAIYEDTDATNSGGAYVFSRSGTTWSQEALIKASDAATSDHFGEAVSIDSDGDTAIVGAAYEDAGGGNAGAAYVFTRSGTSWSQQAKIQSSDIQAGDYFGQSIFISGDGNTAIIGAKSEDTSGSDAGTVYIFTRSGTSWSQQQKLQAGDAEASDNFGRSVSISNDGNTAIVGANNEDAGGSNAGAAYVFTRSGTTWSQQDKIQSSDIQAGDNFGEAVSISDDGSTAIIGAINEDTTGSSAGTVYIFVQG